jgi:hypothetical protein
VALKGRCQLAVGQNPLADRADRAFGKVLHRITVDEVLAETPAKEGPPTLNGCSFSLGLSLAGSKIAECVAALRLPCMPARTGNGPKGDGGRF